MNFPKATKNLFLSLIVVMATAMPMAMATAIPTSAALAYQSRKITSVKESRALTQILEALSEAAQSGDSLSAFEWHEKKSAPKSIRTCKPVMAEEAAAWFFERAKMILGSEHPATREAQEDLIQLLTNRAPSGVVQCQRKKSAGRAVRMTNSFVAESYELSFIEGYED